MAGASLTMVGARFYCRCKSLWSVQIFIVDASLYGRCKSLLSVQVSSSVKYLQRGPKRYNEFDSNTLHPRTRKFSNPQPKICRFKIIQICVDGTLIALKKNCSAVNQINACYSILNSNELCNLKHVIFARTFNKSSNQGDKSLYSLVYRAPMWGEGGDEKLVTPDRIAVNSKIKRRKY